MTIPRLDSAARYNATRTGGRVFLLADFARSYRCGRPMHVTWQNEQWGYRCYTASRWPAQRWGHCWLSADIADPLAWEALEAAFVIPDNIIDPHVRRQWIYAISPRVLLDHTWKNPVYIDPLKRSSSDYVHRTAFPDDGISSAIEVPNA